jgi:hypothetical protein
MSVLPVSIDLHKNWLKLLCDSEIKPIVKKNIIQNAPSSLLNVIFDISYNILKGNVSTTKAERKKLKPIIKICHQLTDPKLSLKKKRYLLCNHTCCCHISSLIKPMFR